MDKHRHFAKAATECFVTQPTLSMQIQKLEDELGLQLFDRSKQPVKPTITGEKIIEQAKAALNRTKGIEELVKQAKGVISGPFRLGIIPTISPTLLPRFASRFIKAFPDVTLEVEELQTETLIHRLRSDQLDAGIAAIPLKERDLRKEHLYYEPFMAFIPEEHRLSKESFVLQSELDINDILLLHQGHCFRNNVVNLCRKEPKKPAGAMKLQSGNFETLVRLCKQGLGMTLLPYLTAMALKPADRKLIIPFDDPKPTREVGLIYTRAQVKIRILTALKEHLLTTLPQALLNQQEGHITRPTWK